MFGRRQSPWRLATSILLAAVVTTVPLDWLSPSVAALQECSLAEEVRITTCRLGDGETVAGSLDGLGGSATYRIDVLAPDTTIELVLAGHGGPTFVSILDWRGQAVAQIARRSDMDEGKLTARLPLPGVYGVRVSGDASPASPGYRLTTRLQPPASSLSQFWPPPFVPDAGPLRDERQVVRTPRTGTLATPSVHGRALGAPPDGMLTDFTLVADVQFEQIVGPSAFTVRFRYEPEAGGGTGYLLHVNPVGGTASLDTFEDGQRRVIVEATPLPIMPTSDVPNRLVLTAAGPTIRATLDGLPLLEATDTRYSRGLVVVGAVSWSDPVAVTFDHIQVTTPPR